MKDEWFMMWIDSNKQVKTFYSVVFIGQKHESVNEWMNEWMDFEGIVNSWNEFSQMKQLGKFLREQKIENKKCLLCANWKCGSCFGW